MFRPFFCATLMGIAVMTQSVLGVEFARKNSLTARSPLSQSSDLPSPTSFTLERFRKAVGLQDLPQITDAMIQNELESLKDLNPNVQEAIVQKISDEMKNIRADGATPEMVQFFWEEDVPHISWERYKKLPGQTFPMFYGAIRSKSDEAFLAFLGLKSPVIQEDIERAFADIKADLNNRIQQEPKLTIYYIPIKAFFEELEKLPKS